MLRFTLLGYPVRVEWTFWLVAALLTGALHMAGREMFLYLAVGVTVIFVSILCHELGHAHAFRRFGGQPDILLYGMGGLCRGTGRYTRGQSMWISAAGPLASICLFVLALLLHRTTPMAQHEMGRVALIYLLWVNGVWTLMNLLPVLPLDGGQIFQALMAGRANPRAVPLTGLVVAAAVAVLALIWGLFFAALLFAYLAWTNWQRLQGKHAGFW